MKKKIRFLFIITMLFLTSCKTPHKSEGYELNYDLCKTIKSDSSHRLWKEQEWVQELTLNTCDLIIFEVENPDLI